MKSKLNIKCRVEPVGEEGPLVLRLDDDCFISAAIAPPRGSPRGLNVDDLVIFDMQPDGGVDGIEISHIFGIDYASRRAALRRGEKYCRIFLDPSEDEPDANVVMQRRGDVLTIRFLNGAVDSKYLLGPGVTALVGANELLGLSIDMIDFIWPEPVWMKR